MLRLLRAPFTIIVRNHYTMAHPVSIDIPSLNKRISVPTGLFINNEFVPSADSKELIQYVGYFEGSVAH